jgi:uncharacterized protein (TIGR00369 family)
MTGSDRRRETPAFLRVAGLRFEEIGPDRVTGWIELGPEHHQRSGVVHGGVYATAIESAAGIGAARAAKARDQTAVGINNNTHFLRAVSTGRVNLTAEPIHQGRSQQLWEVRIADEQGRLVATGQVRLQNVSQSE